MKFVLLILGGLLLHSTSFAASADLGWLQGNWIGCEDEFLQEKAISTQVGGLVTGANKVLKDGVIVSRDFFEVESAAADSAKITFYDGKSVERVLQCKAGEGQLDCQTADSSLLVSITLIEDPFGVPPHLKFKKTYGGTTHDLDMASFTYIAKYPTCKKK